MSDTSLPPALAPYARLIESLLPKPCCCCPPSKEPPVVFSHGGDGGGDGPISLKRLNTGCSCCNPTPATLAATGVIALVSLRKVASRVSDENLRREMLAGFDRALSQLVDEYCGTPPHPHWLGTQADVVTLIGQLGVKAESYPDPQMREAILDVAAKIASFAAPTGAKARGD